MPHSALCLTPRYPRRLRAATSSSNSSTLLWRSSALGTFAPRWKNDTLGGRGHPEASLVVRRGVHGDQEDPGPPARLPRGPIITSPSWTTTRILRPSL